MYRIRTLVSDFLGLLYPNLCTSCGDALAANDAFCMACLGKLPFTGFSQEEDNLFEQHFWGRVNIHAGTALMYYIPGGLSQNLLHNMKYRNRPDFARRAGRYLGQILKNTGRYDDLDLIIPVPLHWRKLQQRGYNQSHMIALGIADVLNLRVLNDSLIRMSYTETQTRKTRIERVDNLSGCFKLRKPNQVAGKSVLLVDDVLTTGATLEACAITLLEARNVRISMATIACGRV